jgi:sigma-B regulation protein RsbU (phosphoserine phosphatase)
MPGIDGLQFCRAFRELGQDRYVYFILLTSKNEKGEIALGLDAGADDFLTKPVNTDELRARIQAGARILKMERELVDKNRMVTEALGEIRSLYDALDRDLKEAKKLQESLVPDSFHRFPGGEVALMLRSSGHIGGDLVGLYPIDAQRIGLYALDVSGHGVTSAMMTARLAGFLSGATPEQNLALLRNPDGSFSPRPPAEVAALLNEKLLGELDTENYFTLLLAEADLATGVVRMVQAGHPHPALQSRDGTVRWLGDGGLPVGLLPGARYSQFEVRLQPGERLLLYSDGFTECADPQGNLLEEAGLAALLHRHQDLSGRELLETLVWELYLFVGASEFPDDLSAVMLHYTGPG